MNKNELIQKINSETDFINFPKYENSLKIMLQEHPAGVSDSVICKALCLSQAELDEVLKFAIMKLKESVGAKNDE